MCNLPTVCFGGSSPKHVGRNHLDHFRRLPVLAASDWSVWRDIKVLIGQEGAGLEESAGSSDWRKQGGKQRVFLLMWRLATNSEVKCNR